MTVRKLCIIMCRWQIFESTLHHLWKTLFADITLSNIAEMTVKKNRWQTAVPILQHHPANGRFNQRVLKREWQKALILCYIFCTLNKGEVDGGGNKELER